MKRGQIIIYVNRTNNIAATRKACALRMRVFVPRNNARQCVIFVRGAEPEERGNRKKQLKNRGAAGWLQDRGE